MLNTVTVQGSFAYESGRPVSGLVRFTPSRLWVISDKVTWACLAPIAFLDMDGNFNVKVTATDSDAIQWHYQVETPAGAFRLYIPWNGDGYYLKELISVHRVDSKTR